MAPPATAIFFSEWQNIVVTILSKATATEYFYTIVYYSIDWCKAQFIAKFLL
jgi:hypothetical protein